MVDRSEAQFYTMEGVAAAVLMVITAYFVLSGTTVYTPGDTHIIDMQLEQLGNDALRIMDTKNGRSDPKTELETFISTKNYSGFNTQFFLLINYYPSSNNTVNFKAELFYINSTGEIQRLEFGEPSADIPTVKKFSGNENAVRVSRWVFVEKGSSLISSTPLMENRNQTVFLEVLLWRG